MNDMGLGAIRWLSRYNLLGPGLLYVIIMGTAVAFVGHGNWWKVLLIACFTPPALAAAGAFLFAFFGFFDRLDAKINQDQRT